jgi:hypothetical protein
MLTLTTYARKLAMSTYSTRWIERLPCGMLTLATLEAGMLTLAT